MEIAVVSNVVTQQHVGGYTSQPFDQVGGHVSTNEHRRETHGDISSIGDSIQEVGVVTCSIDDSIQEIVTCSIPQPGACRIAGQFESSRRNQHPETANSAESGGRDVPRTK
jgi:hypothetical protein